MFDAKFIDCSDSNIFFVTKLTKTTKRKTREIKNYSLEEKKVSVLSILRRLKLSSGREEWMMRSTFDKAPNQTYHI
jgi:hypothetical protein